MDGSEIDAATVLHNALLLSGYSSASHELSATMFHKPNAKAFDNILHFLLVKLRGITQAKKDFKGLWPVKDARQQKDFRKVVHGLLSELEHDNQLPRRLVAAVPSMFAAAAGHRVVELLCYLACHVLGQRLHEDFPLEGIHAQLQHSQVQETQTSCDLLEPAISVAQAQSTVQQHRFMENAAAYAGIQAQWQSSADQLMSSFSSLQLEQEAIRAALEQVDKAKLSPAEQHKQLLQAEGLWSDLQGHLGSLQGLQQLVNSLIGRNSHPQAVDGQKLQQLQKASTSDGSRHASTADAEAAEPASAITRRIDIVQLLQGLTETVASYSKPISELAGGSGGNASMCELALPESRGGHQPHLAAALAAQQQHLNQQKHLHAALQTDLTAIGAYKQILIQQVAAAMKSQARPDQEDQENVSPGLQTGEGCQGAALQLVPPTPGGPAPLQAAAQSVAAKGRQSLAGKWAAPLPAEGMTAMKQRVQQAARQHERSWTPSGARMPTSSALPPSTVKPSIARRCALASIVRRARDPLACITEEAADLFSNAAAPRRLSYSSPAEHQQAENSAADKHQTVVESATPQVPNSRQADAPLSVAHLMARMQKLRHMT